jgi:hypothetical protein
MLFEKKVTIEVPEILINTGAALGFAPVDLLQTGVRAAQENPLRGSARIALRQALASRTSGVLLVCGHIGSRYETVAHEISALLTSDVTRLDNAPLVLNEIRNVQHVRAISVASHHCIVIASLHVATAAFAVRRISDILQQDMADADLDIIGVIEARSTSSYRIDTTFYAAPPYGADSA